ncbi:MAG: DUF3857 domain-containing protein [Candidatus Latescibacterota bacterium]|jgi:hypothetical protein|nr:MAG: DUF3857 domain-containing protein [Candidatus Latescibacterota bacterium]
MKRFILFGMLAALAASLAAAEPAAPRTAFPGYAETAAKHPNADAVVLYDSLVVSVDGGGRVSRRYHRAVMLFTDNAINRYGDPRILFDAGGETLDILAARVHMRDGSAADAKRNSLNRTTPFSLDLAPDYTDWQEMVVTHVGIEKGCVAELEYTIAGGAASPRLGGVVVFSSEDPVELRVLVVRPPAGAELKALSMNGAPEPQRSAGSWIWTVRDLPGRTPFDGGVWEGDYFPAVCYGTARSWEEALSEIAADLAAASDPFPAAEGPIRGALEGLSTDEEKILAVHRLALESARGISAPFALLASSPRPAARVYDTGYASPIDRAVLLASMLRTAGFEPAFVLASAGRAVSNDVPVPELFAKALVSVVAKDAGELLLDPAAPFERDPSFALAGKTIARLGGKASSDFAKRPHLVMLPAHGPAESRSSLELDLAPGEAGTLAGTGRAVLTGVFSPYHLARSGGGLEEYVATRVKLLFGGAELSGWNPRSLDRRGGEIDFTFTVKLPDTKPGERIYLRLPRAFDAAAAGVERVRLERSSSPDPIALVPCVLEVSCSIELPAGWKTVALPPAVSVRTDAGEAVASTESAGSKRSVRTKLLLERDVVTPALFGSARSLLAALADDRIVLERE